MASRDDQPDILYVIHDGERIVVALDMPGVRGAVEERANSAVELACLVPYPVADNGSPLRDSTISQEPPGLRAARAWYGTGAVVGLSAGAVDRGALRDKRDELEQILVDLPTDTGVWHQVGDRVEQLDAALAAFDGEVDTRLAAFTDLSEHCRRYVREDRAITRAREAVRRADQALSDTRTPVPGEFELADRTAAVLAAYRELTREAPGRW